jgi:PAS domain S-box-containing protein
VAGLVSGLLGLVFLALWLSGNHRLQLFAGHQMKSNSALCLILLGAALALGGRGRPLGRVLAGAAGALAVLTLSQLIFGIELGIDQLLAVDRSGLDAGHPNRMSPNAALSFALLGGALLLSSGRRRAVLVSQLLSALAAGLGALALIGYLYDASFLYQPTSLVRFSAYTAAGVLLVALGTVVLRPDVGLARRFAGQGAGGLLARRVVVVIAILPVLLGWLRLGAQRRGLFDDGAGTTLMVIATIGVLAAVLFVLARSLDRMDERRASSEAELRRSSELTAALARAPTMAEVAAATIELGLPALGACAGSVLILDRDANQLQMLRAAGYAAHVQAAFGRMSIDLPLPITDAVRTRQPLFVSGVAEYLRRYPVLRAEQIAAGHRAWAALPLEGRDQVLGVIALSFDRERDFQGGAREHLLRLAWQCGQAMERALLFDAQRETEERLRLALAASAIGTFEWRPGQQDLRLDQRCKQLVGLSPDDQVSFPGWMAAIHPEDRPGVSRDIERALQPGSDGRVSVVYRAVGKSDGVERWLRATGQASFGEDGEVNRFIGTVLDISDEKRAERELQQAGAEAQQAREQAESASRTKDEFLAMLGHELRNPLSPIVTALHLMQLRGGAQLQKERATIERQVRHMVRLVDDLMDVSRITRGKIDLRRQPVELAAAVTAAMETVSPLLDKLHHRVSLNIPAGLRIDGDPERLSQILSNLLSNAAKYTEADGTIEVAATASDTGDQAVITIRDTGAGITPELLPRIFDMFVQGNRTIERAQGGLGLGLAIVKSLVLLHGGTVTADSGGPGQGSTFTVTLPIARGPAPAAEPPAPAPRRRAATPRRILVVDDNRDAAEALGEALSSEGHEVQLAYDGASALALGQRYRPAVVFLDIGLPVMDGYEVARRLRGLDGGYRPLLVAISGYGQAGDRRRAMEAGFDQHLVKPVAIELTLSLAASAPPAAGA